MPIAIPFREVSSMLWQLLLIPLLVLLNAFFVAVEFAVVAARRTRLEALHPNPSRAVEIVRSWLESPAARDRLIAAAQLGVTIVSLALGAAGEKAFEALLSPLFHDLTLPPALNFLERIFPSLPLLTSLIVVTSLHVVLGEQVPKVAVLRAPERFALLSAPLMYGFTVVFRWFVDLLDSMTRFTLRLMGLDMVGHGSVYSLEELRQILAESSMEGLIPQEDSAILDAVLDLGELTVRQVMVPRPEIIAIPAQTPLREVLRLAAEHALTKFPVYGQDLDDILGVLHIKDLLRSLDTPDFEQRTAADLMRPALFVPEGMPVNQLLRRFRDQRQHIAIVLDEFGGTAGLVTLEDLMDEIIGEVSEPFDEDTLPAIQPQPDGSVLIDGLTLLDEVNEALGLNLEDPHYDTIAGYVLGRLGRIPQEGETIEADGVRLTVLQMDGLRIARLRLERLPTPAN